ncbi:MAG: hypothetical protein V9E87_17180 [Gemmatimonadales bacterium]
MEELFLGRFLPFEEVHVVDDEEIDVAAIAAAEVGHRATVDPLDHFVDELLGADVEHPRRRCARQHLMGNGLHEVRLAEAGRSVDEEGVVLLPRRFGDGVRGGGGQFVRLADDEMAEGVAVVERLGARVHRGGRGRGGLGGRGGDEEVHLGPLLALGGHLEDHGHRFAGGRTRHLHQGRGVLLLVPALREIVRGADQQRAALKRNCLVRGQPGLDHALRNDGLGAVEDSLPEVFGGQRHQAL